MTKETAMKILKELHDNSLFSNRTALETLIPELKESEDERVKKRILLSLEKDLMATKNSGCDTQDLEQCIAWLEKQGTPAKLSEEEQNRYAKVVLTSCAESFIKYLDAHKYEGKMCVSNGECEDIENAFHNAMWDRLHRYYCKYIEKQGEQKPAVTDFNAKDWYVSKVDGKIHDMTYNPADNVEQKQEWSEEDDYNLQCMIAKVTSDIQKGNVGRNNELIDWLKSLKERVQPQPKQEWGEEDEKMAEDLIKGCVSAEKAHHFLHTPKEVSDWLKSIKDRIICKNTI